MGFTAPSAGVASCLELDFSPLELSGSVLDLLTPSRGSSWQRCPMFLLMHRVHGRSCPGAWSVQTQEPGQRPDLQGHRSYADDWGLADWFKCLGSAEQNLSEIGRACGSPNVCSICTLERAIRVSKGTDTIEGAQHGGLTMIDLSTLLWSFRRDVGAGCRRAPVVGWGRALGCRGSVCDAAMVRALGCCRGGRSGAIGGLCLVGHQRRCCTCSGAGMWPRQHTGSAEMALGRGRREKQVRQGRAAAGHVGRWHSAFCSGKGWRVERCFIGTRVLRLEFVAPQGRALAEVSTSPCLHRAVTSIAPSYVGRSFLLRC